MNSLYSMRKREELNIIPRIWATGKMEETEGESGLEGCQGHSFGDDELAVLFRHPSEDVKKTVGYTSHEMDKIT